MESLTHIQICNEAQTVCEWVSMGQLSVLPNLSIDDALILSAAFWGLLAVAWVFKKLQTAF